MAFKVDKNANITIIQGDSGSLVVNGLKTDKNYTIYFAVRDKNRNPVGEELYVNSNYSSSVIFNLTADYTDLFTVPKNSDYAVYYYGIKICDASENIEGTLLLGSSDIGEVNTITVYPKRVEGVS